jgi:hypothetical protein
MKVQYLPPEDIKQNCRRKAIPSQAITNNYMREVKRSRDLTDLISISIMTLFKHFSVLICIFCKLLVYFPRTHSEVYQSNLKSKVIGIGCVYG